MNTILVTGPTESIGSDSANFFARKFDLIIDVDNNSNDFYCVINMQHGVKAILNTSGQITSTIPQLQVRYANWWNQPSKSTEITLNYPFKLHAPPGGA